MKFGFLDKKWTYGIVCHLLENGVLFLIRR